MTPTIGFIEFAAAFLACILLGMSKGGITGIGIASVTIMAIIFGSKESTGVVLPLLLLGDIFAVRYYHRNAERKHLVRVLPWMVLGVLGGVLLGARIDEEIFKQGMAVIILVSLALMVMMDLRKIEKVPTHWTFAWILGSAAGFTTMVGNLAGAFTNVYFLAMQLPKNRFIGTAAWLFLIINTFKLPFHIFVWKTINMQSLINDLYLAPAVLLGLYLGIHLVGKIKERWYRRFIVLMTIAGALALFFR